MYRINIMSGRVMMVISYATIICRLHFLKLERRRLTNFSCRSYMSRNCIRMDVFNKEEEEDRLIEIISKKREMSDSCTQVTYTSIAETTDKQVSDSVEIEVITKLSECEGNETQDSNEKKRCCSLLFPDQGNRQDRRFSELGSFNKVRL